MRWTCARCGRDMQVLESAVNGSPLCHEGESPTCYELYQRGPVKTSEELAVELTQMRVFINGREVES